jgi:hypothetical protein
MLSRPVAVGVIALVISGFAVPAATADTSVTCPRNLPVCVITVDKPPAAGDQTATHPNPAAQGPPACRMPANVLNANAPMPCYQPMFGWWNNADGCYYEPASPQPPPTDPAWEGHYPAGAVYQTTCYGYIGTGGGWVWRAAPPPGYGGPTLTPAELAA